MTAEDARRQAKEVGFAAADEERAKAKPHRTGIRVLGVLVSALFIATAVLTYVVVTTKTAQSADHDARVSCQASVIKNIAAQNDISAATGVDYRKYLADVNTQRQRESDALTALSSATTNDEAGQALSDYHGAIAEEVRLTQAYIDASQRAADQKAQTPVVFQC